MITAVEFIKQQIELDSDTSFYNIDWGSFDKIIQQAKQMEKEQIKSAWIDGVTNWDSEKVVEDYINETFKSE